MDTEGLKDLLFTFGLPLITDIYHASKHHVYLTFARELTPEQIEKTKKLKFRIERTPPLKNRYRVVFVPDDADDE